MKKLLSILLVLSMMISLCAAFSTVSFAEDEAATEGDGETTTTATTVSTKEFFDDEWDATENGFKAEVYNAHGARVGTPNSKWNQEALWWVYENGYKDSDERGKTYYLESDGAGGYSVKQGTTDTNRYEINTKRRTEVLDKTCVTGEIVLGAAWIAGGYIAPGATSGTNETLSINKFPFDFDISLNGEKEISGLRIYRTYSGDETTVNEDGSYTYSPSMTWSGGGGRDSENWPNHGSYVTKYDLYVKFDGDTDYTCLIKDGTNSANRTFDIDLDYNVKVTDVRLRVHDVSGRTGRLVDGQQVASYVAFGGITVLTGDKDNETFESNSALVESIISKSIDTRVIGSLENKETIEAMEKSYGEEAVSSYRETYEAKTVKEVKTEFGTVTAESPHTRLNNAGQTVYCSLWHGERLIDGNVSPDDCTNPSAYYAAVDYSVYPPSDYLTITLPITEGEAFTGIRFYSRKHSSNNYYQTDNSAKKAEITLYGEAGETYVETGLIESVIGDEKGPAYSGIMDVNYRYCDFKLSFGGEQARIKDVSKIVIVVEELYSGNHWGSEEVRLINDSNITATAKTVSEIKQDMADNAVDERVPGSLENKRTLAEAKTTYPDHDYSKEEASYEAATVKELETTFGTVTATSPHKKGDDTTVASDKDSSASTRNLPYLIDNKVSADSTKAGQYTAVDYGVYPGLDQYITVTLPITDGEAFTGVRFYARKIDSDVYYQDANSVKLADVTLYDANGKAYTKTDLVSVKGVPGPKNAGARYVDLNLDYRVSDVSKIVVVIKMLWEEDYHHWGSEEVRLINDSVVEETKTVAQIGTDAVVLGNVKSDTGVLNDKGIIRFITEFEKIADGTEIEYFGTYVIKDGAYDETKVKKDSDNVGVYYVSDANVGRQPKVGEKFSVDVKGIDSGYYETGVTAVSFVKIAGYDNLILTGITSGIEVNKDRTVELPKAETTTETTGTEE